MPKMNALFQDKTTSKRKNQVDTNPGQPNEKRLKLIDDDNLRRSSRHHKMRGEKVIEISSTTKLWDLKIKVEITDE